MLPLDSNKIISLIELCIIVWKFVFNNAYYKQDFGMAMGNSLSAILSNIYMEFYENRYLSNILPRSICWLRYVDDILCIWPVEWDEKDFLTVINNQVPSIKFTLEVEVNKCLPFFDVLIYRDANRLQYWVYRKPTNNLSYVQSNSYHDDSVKNPYLSPCLLEP